MQLSAVFGSASGSGVVSTYDDLGRKLTETFNGRTVGYGYDVLGNRTQITWADGFYVRYAYDYLNRMKTATANGSTLLATYGYDGIGHLASLTYGSGATQTLTWSAQDDLLSLSHDLSGSSYDVTYSNSFSPAHQIVSAGISNSLFAAAAGTAGTTGYVVNGLNQYATLSGTGAATIAYDANGNLTSDGTFAYTYDGENRLLTATSSETTASYAYDPLGRRYSKTVNGTATSYLDAGDDEIAEYDAAGALTSRYVPGAGTDRPIARVAADGTVNYFHADRLGSTIALSDTSGALSEGPYTYDAYGNGSSTGSAAYRYAGRRLDPETGLYYYRARYYSPALGRFLQTDPVGYKDDLNWYAYVGDDPTDKVDPSGLSDLVYDMDAHTITVENRDGDPIATFPAYNNVVHGATQYGEGTYNYDGYREHPESGPNDKFGSHGAFRFPHPGCPNCEVHAGRANATHTPGPQHKTQGCIRTTDEATAKIAEVNKTDPLTSLTVTHGEDPSSNGGNNGNGNGRPGPDEKPAKPIPPPPPPPPQSCIANGTCSPY